MLDEWTGITDISGDGGAHGKGHVVAEFDTRRDLLVL